MGEGDDRSGRGHAVREVVVAEARRDVEGNADGVGVGLEPLKIGGVSAANMHQGKPGANEHVDAFPRALGPCRATDGQHVAFRLDGWPFAGPHGGVHAGQEHACVQVKHGLDARLNVG